jgi:uncharacterized protein (DUF1697 family)
MALVVFLRGVNVGGHKTFRPSVLAGDLTHLDVVNVGAAGSFVAFATTSQKVARAEFAKRLPFAAEMMICTGADIARLVAADPFAKSRDDRPFVAVLSRRPTKLPRLPITFPSGDAWEVKLIGVVGTFALGHWRMLGKSPPDATAIIERALGARATNRTWNTILKIREVLDKGRAKATR